MNTGKGSGKPRKFALLQNVPNPFSDSTEIRFRLPRKCMVQLYIYDKREMLVRILVARMVDAGEHSVIWNGKSNDDESIPEGIYVLKMTAAEYEQKRKLVLIR